MAAEVLSMSVVIPVLNEGQAVDTIVPAVREMLSARGGEWEIIVVDNASEDDTAARVAPYLEDPRITLLRNDRNHGKGYSVRRGMLAATCELRLLCDADCTASLGSLPQMEALIADCDIVAGARNAPDSRVGRFQPIRRRLVSSTFIFLCRRLVNEPLRDVFCGFKLFRAQAAEDVFARVQIEGWAFDAEALALARALGYRVQPCGIAWSHRPGSRLSIPRIVLPVLRELFETRAHVRRERARDGASHRRTNPAPSAPSQREPDRHAIGAGEHRAQPPG